MAISEVDRISVQNQAACAEARTPSSTSSLPMKPDSGGMPGHGDGGEEEQAPHQPALGDARRGGEAVALRAAALGDEVGDEEERAGGEGGVDEVVQRGAGRLRGEHGHGGEQHAHRADHREARHLAEAARGEHAGHAQHQGEQPGRQQPGRGEPGRGAGVGAEGEHVEADDRVGAHLGHDGEQRRHRPGGVGGRCRAARSAAAPARP
jgi:hypothetical protein